MFYINKLFLQKGSYVNSWWNINKGDEPNRFFSVNTNNYQIFRADTHRLKQDYVDFLA